MSRFIILCVLLSVLLFISSKAQEQITVPLRVGEDLVYDISFVPTSEGARDIATRFCQERKDDFGITDETLPGCIDPVLTYLSQFVKQEPVPPVQEPVPTEPEISVPLKVGEREFTITFLPTQEVAIATADVFCREHGPTFGITDATSVDDCITPVSDYLKGAAEREQAARITRRRQLSDAEEAARQLALQPDDIQVPMKIADFTYSISWNSRRTNARNMAIKFCTEQGGDIQASFDDCLAPVEAHLTTQAAGILGEAAASAAAAEAAANVRVVKATVQVAGREYEFRFDPSESEALRMARNFCAENAQLLGVNQLPETIEVECTRPILVVLMAALDKVK